MTTMMEERTDSIYHFPRLDTVLMVEEYIRKHSGEYKKKALWTNLPKKMMYQTFNVIYNYLLESGKIAKDSDGKICWIWNPELVKRYMSDTSLAMRLLDGKNMIKCKVVFADKQLKKAFDKLKNSNTEDANLYTWLNRAFDDICANAFCGIQVPKKQIPKEYLKKYGIDNLWKYDLPKAWRLMYSVARDEIVVVSIVLEWLPHKEYERRFKY